MLNFKFSLLATCLFPVLSFPQELRIRFPDADEQVMFGIKQIREKSKGRITTPLQTVTIIADSVKAGQLVKEYSWAPVKSFADQCYSIRFDKGKKNIFILSGETTGAMYGALDIAEAIECHSIDQLKEGDHAPYLKKRGIKFNIPIDLRTPSYSDPGDAHQQNIPDVWDLDFWQAYFDEMALHRYNVMTWWSLQPFPSMVKVPEFPDVALNDVWRTREKYDDTYSSRGLDFDRPGLFREVEVVKKITIEEKIVFWEKVMQMAANRGIDIYLFTWNKFTYGATGKDGITNRQDNDTTIAWFRASVREMIKTYPLLKGIGITAGEGMENNRKDDYANEKWLWKTYGEGIRDGLKGQPGRDFTLIHRMHWSSLKEVQDAFRDLPCRLELSLKYAIAHMYSIPDPPFILPAMPLLSPQLQSWLTLRNDDVYSFRWANYDYVNSFISSIPEVQKIAGFYMGPDGYCWGRDYLSKLNKNKQPPLVIRKQWYSFMLWGRLSYDPDLPDRMFLQHLPEHFPSVNTRVLMKGWSAASMIFPWITRYVWGDIDLKWFPEANLSHPTHKGFYTVKDYAEREPMPGSHIEPMLTWVSKNGEGPEKRFLGPPEVADTLDMLSDLALASLKELPAASHNAPDETDQTLSDIEGFAWIGKYYAEKIRAACDLALLDTKGSEIYRESALQHLERAKSYWHNYAVIYSAKNKPALYNRVGIVDMENLEEKVNYDFIIVRNWKAGSGSLKTGGNTEVPFKQ